MSLGMMGRKVGMTQVFSSEGLVVPVTVVLLEGNQVLDVRKYTRHSALLIGFEERTKKTIKAVVGYFKALSDKLGVVITPKKYIKEFSFIGESLYKPGDVLTTAFFQENEKVSIIGRSKGKGTQGVVKRHKMSGGRASHGSHFHRRVGSIGSGTFPARVWKGQKMGGRMGNEQVTVRNLLIYKIDTENNLLYIKGAVPGGKRALLYIKKQG